MSPPYNHFGGKICCHPSQLGNFGVCEMIFKNKGVKLRLKKDLRQTHFNKIKMLKLNSRPETVCMRFLIATCSPYFNKLIFF